MIGQKSLLQYIDKLVEYNFPRFSVITGVRGSGKKLIAKYIADKLNYPLITFETKIDDIRNMIELAYQQTEPIIYLIPDADTMSLGAKNSLLKIIEEPPNNAYFIMTLQTIQNTLPTIKSRCLELKMQLYTSDDIKEMITLIDPNLSQDERNILYSCCDNYYELELAYKYDVLTFYNYVKKVYDNIHKVQSANSFKILDKLKLKEDETEKYDIELFLKIFNQLALNDMTASLAGKSYLDKEAIHQANKFANIIDATAKVIKNLKTTGINKTSLLDIWILDIRKIWRD